MNKRKTKFFASPFFMFGAIFVFLLVLGFWLFTLFFPFADLGRAIDNMSKFLNKIDIFVIIIIVLFPGFCGIASIVILCYKGFSLFEISEQGIKRSLFKVFKKMEISWGEMQEIRCYGMITRWLFFSKTSLENLSYNEIIKRKDVLQLEYSKSILGLIRMYTDKEIINLPEERIEKLDKKT